MVPILARRSRANIPMARPNEPGKPSKRIKKVLLGIYRTQIHPKFSVTVTPTPLFQSECLNACRRSWRASSSLVLAGTFFCAFFDRKTLVKSLISYELFVYWKNPLFAAYCTVTLLYLKVTMISGDWT